MRRCDQRSPRVSPRATETRFGVRDGLRGRRVRAARAGLVAPVDLGRGRVGRVARRGRHSVEFEPTEAQARAAAHLGNSLELARITAGGTEERIAELRDRLDRATRALRRAETDLETARRRLRFAQHCGRSSLAELPMGEDAGAFRSVYYALGDALARAIRDASRDPERYETAVVGLERRKTLVVDRRLADRAAGARR